MKKRFLYHLVLAFCAFAAVADVYADSVKIGSLYYYLNDTDKTASVTYENLFQSNYLNLTEADIPAAVDYEGSEYTVTAIGYLAFKNCRTLKSVSLPETLLKIGESAFYGCESLMEVSVPDGVVSIDDAAFKSCSRLASVSLGKSLMTIDGYAFEGCSRLSSIVLPESLVSIGKYALSSCARLEEVRLPEGVSAVPDGLFNQCMSLKTVEMSDNVISIGDLAFSYCEGLGSIRLPSELETIGKRAFMRCNKLVSLTLPAKVTTIGDGALYNGRLTELISLNPVPPTLIEEDYSYRDQYDVTAVYVPAESLAAYKSSPVWKNFSQIEVIGSPVVGIEPVVGENSFEVKSGEGMIMVDNLPPGTEIGVFGLNGGKIYEGVGCAVSGLAAGMYVVKVGGNSVKVLVR